MKRLFRAVAGVVTAVCLAACGTSVNAEPVGSTTRAITITEQVRIRPNPNTQNPELAMMPAGATPTYICFADGEYVGGTTKWFKVSWNGVEGYYSSIADDVPLSLQNDIQENYGIPKCGTGVDINQGSGADATVTVQPEEQVTEPYNRGAAVNWALGHAQNVRTNMFADCTWFVSQALWAGGLHQTSWWNDYESRQGAVLSQPGTDIARAAPDLARYLGKRFPVTVTPLGPERFHGNVVPEAQTGDIIAYDWENDGTIDHLSFVTNIAPGQYPEVSEWGTTKGWSPYQKRGWTWSVLNGKWLQQQYPANSNGSGGVTAQLIHFDLPG